MPASTGGDADAGRRAFLVRAAAAVGAPSLAAWCQGCASLVTHPVVPVDGTVRVRLADFPELARAGGAVRLQAGGTDATLLVVTLGDARFAALSATCTHRGCSVDLQAGRLVCPCHGSTYDLEGRVLRGPAERSLTRFPVTLARGEVLVVELEAPR